jgi:proline iminopeptidase
MLQVGSYPAHTLFWEEYGNAAGEPVMFLHGGPGGACDSILSRFFDPSRYRVILFDQRGCGKSRPSVATDGAKVALTNNTTDFLVEDILKLRDALNIRCKMHVFGGSWGSTLAMAYAIKHPETVETLILRGIFIGRSEDLRYMYQGNAATYAEDPNRMTAPGAYISYPEAWKEFVEIIPPEKRDDMMKAYKDTFDMNPANDADKAIQMKAAITWSVWEGVISNLVPDLYNVGKFDNDDFAICFAQIEAHYFAHNLFMAPTYLIDNVKTFAHIPIHITHGRFDQVCPLTQAEILVAALRRAGAEPCSYIKTTAGHSMLERENYIALTDIMDSLPRMSGFNLTRAS